jgi:uncharacterized protein with GYD domain
MPKYLFAANYNREGVKGLIKEGASSRRTAIEKLFQSVGGTVEALYYAFGEPDLYGIVDMPDQASMTSVAMTVNASGAATVKTTPLMTPEEVDAATKLSPAYRAPGQ